MSEKIIYISGAIEHHDINERKKAFENAEKMLLSAGYHPINPFKNGLPEDAHWRDHMKVDIQNLTSSDCKAIYMLEGWEQSKGAKLEFDIATSCGHRVYYEKVSNIKIIENE